MSKSINIFLKEENKIVTVPIVEFLFIIFNNIAFGNQIASIQFINGILMKGQNSLINNYDEEISWKGFKLTDNEFKEIFKDMLTANPNLSIMKEVPSYITTPQDLKIWGLHLYSGTPYEKIKKRNDKYNKLCTAYQDAIERGDRLAADKWLATIQSFELTD